MTERKELAATTVDAGRARYARLAYSCPLPTLGADAVQRSSFAAAVDKCVAAVSDPTASTAIKDFA